MVLQPLSGGAELIDLSGVQPGQRVQAAHNNTQSSVQVRQKIKNCKGTLINTCFV